MLPLTAGVFVGTLAQRPASRFAEKNMQSIDQDFL